MEQLEEQLAKLVLLHLTVVVIYLGRCNVNFHIQTSISNSSANYALLNARLPIVDMYVYCGSTTAMHM